MSDLVVFGLNGSQPYARKIASFLDMGLTPNEEEYFEDDESYIKSIGGREGNVRDKDVYVIAGFYSDKKRSINEKFVDLLFFIGSLRDASARRITAVLPYMGYARQDRKTESRAPITTKYVAQAFEGLGLDRVLTIDVHSLAAFQNSFRIPADNLDTVRLFTDFLCGSDEGNIDDPLQPGSNDLVVLTPDIGGLTRNARYQAALEKRLKVNIPLAVFDKRRVEGVVQGSRIIGDVKGKRVILFDDMIASGSTVAKASEAVEAAGGRIYAVCATHGLFTGDAQKKLSGVKRLVITDTIPPFRLDLAAWGNRLQIVPTARFVARAIRRTHEGGGSISDLLEDAPQS